MTNNSNDDELASQGTINTHQQTNNEYEESESNVEFGSYLDRPSVNDASKMMKDNKFSSLVPLAVTRPSSMTPTILESASGMLKLYERVTQKDKSLEKLSSTSAENEGYVPTSVRRVSPITAPANMNGNTDVEALVQEGHDVNEYWKQKTSDIIRRTEIVKKDKAIRDLQYGILDTLMLFAQLLVTALLACADPIFNPNLDVDSIALMTVMNLLLQQDEDTEKLFREWKYTDKEIDDKAIQAQFKRRNQIYAGRMTKIFKQADEDTTYLSVKAAEDLYEMAEHITVTAWKDNDKKERIKKMNADLKAIAKKDKQNKKNAEMQVRIAAQEEMDKEALAKGAVPPTLEMSMKNLVKEEMKRSHAEEKKQRRKKSSGGGRAQPSTPGRNGARQSERSNARRGRQNRDASQQQNAQHTTSNNHSRRRGNQSQNTRSTNNTTNTYNQNSSINSRGRGRGRGRGRSGEGRGGRGGRRNERETGGRGRN